MLLVVISARRVKEKRLFQLLEIADHVAHPVSEELEGCFVVLAATTSTDCAEVGAFLVESLLEVAQTVLEGVLVVRAAEQALTGRCIYRHLAVRVLHGP